MHPSIESIFNEAETRYLNSDELGLVSQYIDSIPQRLDLYRSLREQEVKLLQPVVDHVQKQLPQEDLKRIERATKNGILALRSCAMAMLLNDEGYIQERVEWLHKSQQNNNLQAIDRFFYSYLEQQLQSTLGNQAMALLSPPFQHVKKAVIDGVAPSATASSDPNPASNSLDLNDDELDLSSLF